jgi:hypothetical protein
MRPVQVSKQCRRAGCCRSPATVCSDRCSGADDGTLVGVSEQPPGSDPGQPSPWQPPPPGWMPPPQQQPGWQPHPPPYGAPPQQPGGWYGQGGYGYPRPQDTNGFAIASLVSSLVGIFLLIVGPLLGIIFGIVALKQIPRLGQAGRGLAIAGIVIGAVVLFLDVVGLIAIAADSTSSGSVGVEI